jgi:hypothetical protein
MGRNNKKSIMAAAALASVGMADAIAMTQVNYPLAACYGTFHMPMS